MIIDITQELFSSKLFPGDAPPVLELVRTVKEDGYNLSNLSMCVHNGTHADAPRHFIDGGKTMEQLAPEIFYGACAVAEFKGEISPEDLAPVLAGKPERLLLKGECQLSEAAAQTLVSAGLKLVGTESQSIGHADAPAAVHVILLGAEVIPLEGLDLSRVAPGEYALAAFPLKLGGSDGAPVRAVLIK